VTSIKLLACACTLLALLGSGCSSSSTPAAASGSSGTGGTQKVTGIAVPQHVAVVTATNAG